MCVCSSVAVAELHPVPALYVLHPAPAVGIAVVGAGASPGCRLSCGDGRGAAAPARPGCRSEGWGASNAVILPLFEYLHISFNKTAFLKIKCPVELGLWVDKCVSVTSSYHNTASEQELSLGWR